MKVNTKRTKTLMEAMELTADADCYLFDMDGLIFDTERLFMEQLGNVMAERGYTLTKEIYVQTLGLGGEPLRALMASYYGEDYPFEEMGRQTMLRMQQIVRSQGFTIKPEIVDVLKWIRHHNKKAAVASSTKSTAVREYLDHARLTDYFVCIIGGEMVKNSKPSPDIFQLAAKTAGVTPSSCVVLEDSENGIRAAHSAGMRSICVPDLKEPSEEIQQMITVLVQRS